VAISVLTFERLEETAKLYQLAVTKKLITGGKMKKAILTICTMVFCMPIISHAVVLYCKGEVKQTYVTSEGYLIIKGSWRDHYSRLCDLKGTVNNIDPLTCSMWSSYAVTAMANKKKVRVSFTADAGVTCETLATYNDTPAVRYVMLTNEDVL